MVSVWLVVEKGSVQLEVCGCTIIAFSFVRFFLPCEKIRINKKQKAAKRRTLTLLSSSLKTYHKEIMNRLLVASVAAGALIAAVDAGCCPTSTGTTVYLDTLHN